jgi:hypothetical protein
MGGAVIGFTTGLAILFRRARLAANFNLH